MAASEQSSPLNLVFDDWQLSGNRYGRFGSVAALQRVTKLNQAVTGQEQSLEVGFQFELPKPILSSFNDRLSASKNNYRNLWGH